MMHRRFFQRTTLQQDNPDNHTLFQMPDFFVSGPVIIPKLYNGKNKTFFQVGGSYHIDSSSNAGNYTTPTPEMLAGNFSAYSNQIYDPNSTSGSFAAGNLSRTPFPGNIIPTNRFSTMWNAIAANKPFLPPQAGTGSITNTGPNGNIVTSGTGNYFNLTNQFRVDHNLNSKMRTDAQLLHRQPASAAKQRQHRLQAVRSIPDAAVHRPEPRRPVVHLHDQPHAHQRDQSRYLPADRQLPAAQPAKTTRTRSPRPFPTCPPTCTSTRSTSG